MATPLFHVTARNNNKSLTQRDVWEETIRTDAGTGHRPCAREPQVDAQRAESHDTGVQHGFLLLPIFLSLLNDESVLRGRRRGRQTFKKKEADAACHDVQVASPVI